MPADDACIVWWKSLLPGAARYRHTGCATNSCKVRRDSIRILIALGIVPLSFVADGGQAAHK